MNELIGVVPLGEVPKLAVEVIAANITAYYKLPADILPMLPIPESAFDEARLKYNAGILINKLDAIDFDGYSKIVAVISRDMFIPIFNYVYGQAVQGGSLALVSLFRLDRNADGSIPSASLVFERAAKLALHELGHLFDLFHCNETKCIMHFSGVIEDLNKIPFYLCRDCARRLPRQG
jgi:archaemetzincin